MKIIIDSRWVRNRKIDGIGRYVLELAKNILDQDKENEYLFLFSSLENKEFFERNIGRQIKSEIVPFEILTPKDILFLPRFLKKLSPDIFFSPNYLTSPIHKGYNTILTVHDFIPYFFKYARASVLWRIFYLFRLQTKMILKRAQKIIAVSESTAKDTKALFDINMKKIEVIHEGVDPRFRALSPGEISARLEKFDLAPGYILYVGRQDPYKNIAGLIRAYNYLSPDLKDLHKLVIIGRKNPRYFGGLESLVKESGLEERVIFIDYADDEDLVALYNGARIATLLTYYEGFGFPILEAQACGVPVICSNISSHPEVAGGAALLVDPYDIGEISNALNLVLTNEVKRKELIESGLKNVKRFSWSECARKTIALFKK